MAEVELPPKVGDIVNDTYKIVRKISHGDFRPIFCTIDIKMRQIALMLEKDTDGQTEICIESAILKILANSNHIPKFYKYGSYKSYKFLAFQLLGPNMIDLVNYKKPYRFSLHSILKFGIQAIETLQIVHNKDFIHRNIKPGNFLIGNTQETSGTFYLIGFGLCKKLNRKNDIIVKPTKKGRFRGSLKYSSLNAHNHIELGRQDDLISLLYIFVEFYNGALPWPDVDEINIQTLKEQYHGRKLLKRLPKQFLEFESYIQSLDYTTDPDYAYLISLLKQAADENEIDLNAPFEWQEEINEERSNITKHNISLIMKINKSVLELEQKKQQIEQENNENKTEQIEQIDKEIDQQKQLQKKYDAINSQLEPLDIHDKIQDKSSLNKIMDYNSTSHIHPVNSFHYNTELTNTSLVTQNSSQSQFQYSGIQLISNKLNNDPFSNIRNNDPFSNMRNNDPFSNMRNSDPFSSNSLGRRSSVLSPPLFLGKSNTVQEFIEVLDALTGIKSDDSFNPFDINPRSESQSPVRQDNYVEQFIDGMKKKDDKYKQFDWNSFVEQTGGSHQNEGFDGIDISERDDPHSDTTTQSSTVPQYLSFLNRNSISLQKSQSGSQVSLEIYSPPIVEDSQQSPHINMYRQRYLSPSNSAKERKISPEILSQEVHPINEVIIHNQPGSSRTHNTLLANLMVNKSPQLFIQQVRQQFDPTPKSPLGVKITEELKDWGMNESQKNAMGGIKEQDENENCYDYILQIDEQKDQDLHDRNNINNQEMNSKTQQKPESQPISPQQSNNEQDNKIMNQTSNQDKNGQIKVQSNSNSQQHEEEANTQMIVKQRRKIFNKKKSQSNTLSNLSSDNQNQKEKLNKGNEFNQIEQQQYDVFSPNSTHFKFNRKRSISEYQQDRDNIKFLSPLQISCEIQIVFPNTNSTNDSQSNKQNISNQEISSPLNPLSSPNQTQLSIQQRLTDSPSSIYTNEKTSINHQQCQVEKSIKPTNSNVSLQLQFGNQKSPLILSVDKRTHRSFKDSVWEIEEETNNENKQNIDQEKVKEKQDRILLNEKLNQYDFIANNNTINISSVQQQDFRIIEKEKEINEQKRDNQDSYANQNHSQQTQIQDYCNNNDYQSVDNNTKLAEIKECCTIL